MFITDTHHYDAIQVRLRTSGDFVKIHLGFPDKLKLLLDWFSFIHWSSTRSRLGRHNHSTHLLNIYELMPICSLNIVRPRHIWNNSIVMRRLQMNLLNLIVQADRNRNDTFNDMMIMISWYGNEKMFKLLIFDSVLILFVDWTWGWGASKTLSIVKKINKQHNTAIRKQPAGCSTCYSLSINYQILFTLIK